MRKLFLSVFFLLTVTSVMGQLSVGTLTKTQTTICSNGQSTITVNWSGGTPNYTVNFNVMDPNNVSAVLRTFTREDVSVTSATYGYQPQNADIIGISGDATIQVEVIDAGSESVVFPLTTISVTPGPTADAGPDQTICESGSVNLAGSASNYSSVSWSSSGTGTFDDASSLSPIYTPSTADAQDGFIILTLDVFSDDVNCSSEFADMFLTIESAPNAGTYIGTAADVCNSETAFDLNTLLDGSQDVGGSWSDDDGSGAFISGSVVDFIEVLAGTYNFTYTVVGSGACPDDVETVTVNVSEAPFAGFYVGNPAPVCNSETAFDLTTGLDGSQYFGGTWSDDNGSGAIISGDFADFTGVSPGTYDFTYTVTGPGACPDDSETVSINVEAEPSAGTYIGVAAEICTLDPPFDLSTLLDGSQDGGGFWNDISGSEASISGDLADFGPVLPGTYDFEYVVTGAGSCPSATEVVTVNLSPPPNAGTYLGTPGEACTNDSAFDLSILLDGTEDLGGAWSDLDGSGASIAGNSADFNGIVAGTYDFVYTVAGVGSCADATSTVTVNISEAPTVSVDSETAICEGETLDLTAVSPSFTLSTGVQWTTSGDGSFTPDANSLTPTYNPGPIDMNAGSVNLTITTTGNGICSASSAIVNVNISRTNNAGTYVGTAAEVCATETAFDFTTLLDGSQDAGGSWIDSDGSGATISGDFGDFNGVNAGTYNFEYLVSDGVCADAVSSVAVVVNNIPQITINTSIESCGGVVLDLSAANPAFSSFESLLWSSSGDGSFNDNAVAEPLYTPGINDLVNGSVTLTVQASALGSCVDVSESILVTFKESPEITFPANKVFYQENAEIDLNQFSDQIQITGADTYSWNIISGEGTFAAGAASSTQVYPVYTQNESSFPATIVLQLVATNTTTSCPTSKNFEFVIYDNPDYEALIDLYNLNNGESWSDNANWLSDGTSIGDWSGITVDGDNRVIGIDLTANGIEDITPLLSMVNNLTLFDISGNKLSFEQLQPFSAVPDFVFGNQDFEYTIPNEIFESLGTDISITVEANASANTFQWFKDSVPIEGETNQTLNLTNAQRSDEGFYYVEINNSNLPDLTLVSTITEVKISSLERDVIALREFYDSTNGDGWSTIVWDTTSDNPTEWSANDQDIIVEDNRVVEINLPENNLTGSVPNALNEVRGLRTINFANNAIEDLADLTALPNLTQLDLSGNALGYDDLERNISVEGFEFNSQANFGSEPDRKIPQGYDFTLSYEVDGSANVYEWYRNDELISTEDASKITIESITFGNMGEYRLEVKNTVVNAVNSEFTLNSNPVSIIATSVISGNVQDANEFATESGRIYPFSVSTDGSYDSVRLENGNYYMNIQANGFFEIANIELGDYVIFVNNDENSYPELLNTYYPNTIDWELAEIVSLRSDINDLLITMEGEPQELTGTSVLSGYLEEEYEEGERKLPRRKVSGAGVSVRTLSGSSREISFRSILQNNELVAYLETDENGEFEIPNLPAGRYSIKFDIPGVPMNQQSEINFDFTGEDQEALEIAAVSDNGQITVSKVKYTANKSELLKNITVYPNPSDGRFKIAGTEAISNIKLISSEGRLIEEITDFNSISNEVELDISNYPDGMYFMQIIWNDGLQSMNKLIKE
ncbi:T9SS type A sorting domain-containing protein [Marivirga salinae]|uniref:T9SS type A sorting domain-containing protein n=1 Tax=Marivirga salinarum TaxID=3059078 RepID=A0AA51RD97_9BACT|nr:T9SS type A sorting domain-containing protein [Marivirga sp. BDSF4-3]WMN12843.1 T9SS type A sorting domain-containing protein [Marivirga sp. BDSF4-3]